MANEKCKNEAEHEGHICVLASKGLFKEIKALTKNPKFICFSCGRVAHSEKNLCNPMSNEP